VIAVDVSIIGPAEAKQRCRYWLDPRHRNHRTLVSLSLDWIASRSIADLVGRAHAHAGWPRDMKRVCFIEIMVGSSYGAFMTNEEERRWKTRFFELAGIKGEAAVGHRRLSGRTDGHLAVFPFLVNGKKVGRRELRRHVRAAARLATEELNEQRLKEGRFVIGNLREDRTVYYGNAEPMSPEQTARVLFEKARAFGVTVIMKHDDNLPIGSAKKAKSPKPGKPAHIVPPPGGEGGAPDLEEEEKKKRKRREEEAKALDAKLGEAAAWRALWFWLSSVPEPDEALPAPWDDYMKKFHPDLKLQADDFRACVLPHLVEEAPNKWPLKPAASYYVQFLREFLNTEPERNRERMQER